MTQLDDLSKAHKIELNVESVRGLTQPRVNPQASILGQFDLVTFLVGPFGAEPGQNILTVGIAPLGFTPFTVSASITEVVLAGEFPVIPPIPHSGAAFFNTWSVQLDQQGQFIQIAFDLMWQWTLWAAAMLILGCTVP